MSAPLAPAAVHSLGTFAGLGAAVTSFGLASNLLSQTTVSDSLDGWIAWPAALAMMLWAAGLLLWAIMSFRAGKSVLPRLTLLAVGIGGTIEVAVFFWQFAQHRLDGSLLATIALELLMLGSLGWLARQQLKDGGAPKAGRLLVTMFGASLLVSALATAGLAAGTAGQYSIPHSEMQMDFPGMQMGHH
ncbi:hypothetical protein [Psychromicrobium sp. YIM B11713]|uniref:hypothetical protein n=1 Tax=Psychromicrobium sp. YIM B11713 TaxID=3145233 RepID=UPI00374EE15B